MRRFITSLTGKVVSHMVIAALLLPFITLSLYTRARAQVAVLPQVAVVQFKNRVSPGTAFGKTASDAVINEMVKEGHADPIPSDTIDRTIRDMGISNPPDNHTDLLRLAEEVHATSAVTGDILAYRIFHADGGKYAIVQLEVTLYDVASGVAVNGAAIKSQSTTRTGDASDETVINDAITQGANRAVAQIHAQALPFGTVLNTGTDSALINKGARSGFKVGQEVIVLRNREQVATARVTEVEPDASYIHVESSNKGMQPGDIVRAVWEPPVFKYSNIDKNGNTAPVVVHRNPNNSGLITTLLIVGLVGAFLVGSGSTDTGVTSNVVSEAMTYPQIGGVPAVKVSWTPNIFAKGNSEIAAWQVWRNDVTDGPVLVVPQAPSNDAVDFSQTPLTVNFFYTGGIIGGQTCNFTSPLNNTGTTIGLVPGEPYIYSVELAYALNIIDLPGAGTAASSTASGTSTATGTGTSTATATSTSTGTGTGTGGIGTGTGTGTGGIGTGTGTGTGTSTSTGTGTSTSTGTGTTATGGTFCYFLSSRMNAVGLATPLNAPALVAPADNSSAPVNTAVTFQAGSVASDPTYTLECQYVLQLSTSPSFPGNATVTIGPTTSNAPGGTTVTVATVDTSSAVPAFIANANTFYWRVGARNAADKPGPVPDATTRQRYIFSSYRTLTRPGSPPGGPSKTTKPPTTTTTRKKRH